MKKLLCLLIVGVMALTVLAGCGNAATAGTPQASMAPEMPSDKYPHDTKEPYHTEKTYRTETTSAIQRPGSDLTRDPQNTTSSTTEVPNLPGQNEGSWLKSLSGTERAKLLLANQRLDATVLNTDGDIFESGAEVMYNLIDIAIANLGIQYADEQVLTPILEENTTVETIVDEFGTTVKLGDKTVSWSNFPESNNSYGAFLGTTRGIVQEAEIGAELINFVKKNMRVINKWVNFYDEKYYLQVDANSETLFRIRPYEETIIKRYKNEAGKDVYEMYRLSSNGYENRMLYIPGERYEFTDSYKYFTADKSKGYWEVYSMNDAGSHYNVSYFIIKDDICYDAFYDPERGNIPLLKVMSSDRKTDIFNISTYFDEEYPEYSRANVDIKFSGFDGIDYVETKRDNIQIIEWSGEGDVAYATNGFQDVFIHMQNGKVIQLSDTYFDGKIGINLLNVAFTVGEGYSGQVGVRINAPTWEGQINLLREFLDEMGMVCRRDMDKVFEGIDIAYEELETIIKYYKWNGVNVSTEAGIAEAILKEKARCEALNNEYKAIENEESVEYTSSEDMEIHINFAPVTNISVSGVSLNGLKATVPAISLTINDTTLYVEEEAYKVMFALKAANGGLVHFDIKNETEVKYAGESEFTVNAANASFELPEVAAGEYTVVCYIATADGIRSSAYTELKFEKAEGLPVTLSSSELSAVIGEGGTLTLTYTQKLDHYASAHSVKALDFEAFKKIVGEEAFKYGTPNDSVIEKLTGEEYVPLTGEETEIESGMYRVFYSVKNGAASKMGYVYIAYDRRIPEVVEAEEALDFADFKEKADEIAARYEIEYTAIEKLAGEEFTPLTGAETKVEFGIYRIVYTLAGGEKTTTEYIYIEIKLPERTEVPETIAAKIETSTAYDYAAFKAEVDILAEKYGVEYTVIEKLTGEEYVPLTGEETAIEAGEYRVTQIIGEGEEAVTKTININYVITPTEDIPVEKTDK